MTTRRPLVFISGVKGELPVGDTIDAALYQGQQVVAGSGLVGGGLFSTNPRLDVALVSNPSGIYFAGGNKLGFDGQGDNIQVIASGTGAVYRTLDNKLRDVVSVKDFGAVGDGVTDDAPEIQAALDYSIANDKALYFPEGVYLIDGTGLTNNRIEPAIPDGSSIVLFGAGPGKTIIKEKDASVLNHGTNHFTLYFNILSSRTVNNLIVRDMTLDKNGASNGPEPSSYAWEQAHIIRVAVDSTSTLRYVNFQNLELLDQVGAGICFASGYILNAEVHNCHVRNFSELFGQRGDFEFQSAIDNLSFTNCSGLYAQCEPTVVPPAGVKPLATFRNCHIDILELTAYSSDPTLQTLIVDSCVADSRMTIRNAKAIITNSRFQVNSGNTGYWSRVALGSVVSNCTIVNEYDSGTNSIYSFYPRC